MHRFPIPRHGLLPLLCAVAALVQPSAGNPWNGKVVLQAFWWNCENRNYGNTGWYTYLTKLAPRLRETGFDGIWLPSPGKAAGGTGSMGYDAFDLYDLGHKDQKGTVPTRFGTMDEFLRLIAVAHANGLEVYPDVVLNHCQGGAVDPDTPAEIGEKHRLFRYRGFAGENRGRWSKGWGDFHPNWDHWDTGTEVTREMEGFGRDVCFRDPCGKAHPSNMRDKSREWFVWFHKQTGADGFRFDAVEHFPPEIVEDLLFNAMGQGKEYFCVGEFVESDRGPLDEWCGRVQNRCGLFDFPLRNAITAMVRGEGFFDMGSLPSAQLLNRFKTVPFVNSHDTYKGAFWNSASDISTEPDDHDGDPARNKDEILPTINPDDPRADLAYAAAMAVDGSPMIYYDDLFENYHPSSRTRADPAAHPLRPYLANLIWCHQKLNFKDGAYKVPFQESPDLLVLERAGRALIALNDNGKETKAQWVQTSFGSHRRLHDYSGTVAHDITTEQDGRVEVVVPPMSYSVWGPAGIEGGFDPPARKTVQEFQMDDDLGDDSPHSLHYGGKLVAGDFRTGGAVWIAAGTEADVRLYTDEPREAELCATRPQPDGNKSTADGRMNAVGNAARGEPLHLRFTAEREGYHLLQARLAENAAAPVRGYIVVEYHAPARSDLIGR